MTDEPAACLIKALVGASGGAQGAVAMARRVGLGGFAARHLGLEHEIPRAERLAFRLHETVLVEAAAEASTALSLRGVPHFVAKGVAFIGTLYEPGDREIADLDLWVHPDGVPAARGALGRIGYAEAPPGRQSGPASLRAGSLWVRGSEDSLDGVALDAHWGVNPVTRILPRPGHPLPDEVWAALDRRGPFPVPDPGHHAALLVHHLVHHDLLHVRGLLDLALLWRRASSADRLERLARHLGVWRAARALGVTLARDLGFMGTALAAPPHDWRGRRLARLLMLDRWVKLAAHAPERDHYEMTSRRLGRRVLLLDRAADIPGLLADGVWPPAEHVRWRWPAAPTALAARWRHARHVLGKLRVT